MGLDPVKMSRKPQLTQLDIFIKRSQTFDPKTHFIKADSSGMATIVKKTLFRRIHHFFSPSSYQTERVALGLIKLASSSINGFSSIKNSLAYSHLTEGKTSAQNVFKRIFDQQETCFTSPTTEEKKKELYINYLSIFGEACGFSKQKVNPLISAAKNLSNRSFNLEPSRLRDDAFAKMTLLREVSKEVPKLKKKIKAAPIEKKLHHLSRLSDKLICKKLGKNKLEGKMEKALSEIVYSQVELT